jgi:SAM-dependent methyltransferase
MLATAVPEGALFYHTIDLPEVGTVEGVWDHRATAEPYLGRVNLAGKRLLEIGPANGFFSFELERRGARVVSLELAEDSDWDRVPHPYVDEAYLREALRRNVEAARKAWLFAHGLLGSRAECVRGTVYDAPRLVDRVDVAFFGNVLQHLRDPLLALQRAAEVTRETLIVSESMWMDSPDFRENAQMRLIPRLYAPEVSHSFWAVSPALVVELARLLGFAHTRVEYHDQRYNIRQGEPTMVPHFTVTASRVRSGSAEQAVTTVFGPDWYDEERDDRRSWRWSRDRVASVTVRSEQASKVCIALGVVSANRGDVVTVSVNGTECWRGHTFDACGVTLANVTLGAGDNRLELATAGPINTILERRALGVRLFDLGIAPA